MNTETSILYQWQTLIAGGLATLAAVGTIVYLWREASDQRRRRLAACRAMMPSDLSTICRYVGECLSIADQAVRRVRENGTNEKRGDLKAIVVVFLPERVLGNIQALIEQSHDRDVPALCALLECYQVQHARLSSEVEDLNNPTRLGSFRVMTEDNMLFTVRRTVELYLIATKMFPFARRKAKHIPALKYSESEISNAFSALGVLDVFPKDFTDDLKQHLQATNSLGD